MPTNIDIKAATQSAEDAFYGLPRDRPSNPRASFAIRDLSVLAYANGFKLWHYKAVRIADLLSCNYFGDCADMMEAGDHIHVSASDGSALLAVERVGRNEVAVRRMLS